MRFLLNRQTDGWMMLDPTENRSVGLYDSEEQALEAAWKLANAAGIDALVYSRDSLDDDSIIVISGVKRCPGCHSMRPAEDYEFEGITDIKAGQCKSCRGEDGGWADILVLDDVENLTVN